MKIGIVGPFGDTNFGDYAMFVNNIRTMGRQEYIIFTYNSSFLNTISKTYLSEYKIKECIVNVDYQYEETFTGQYHVEYDTYPYTPLEIEKKIINQNRVCDCLNDVDVLVVSGGGYYNHVWSAKHRKAKLLAIMGVILLADSLNKKAVFMGNTYGPFDGSEQMFANFFSSLRNTDYASRDDVYSINNLKRLGVNKHISLLPDDLYLVEKGEKTSVSDFHSTLPPKYVLLELYESMDYIDENIDLIRIFVKTLKKQYDLPVVLFPLDKRYGGEYQSDKIKALIPDIIYCSFKEREFRYIEEVQDAVCHAEMVVCQRYHLFVFAVANNIPVFQSLKDVCGDKRYYYSKTKGVIKQVFPNKNIERNFMGCDVVECLQFLNENFNEIVDVQRKSYNESKIIAEKIMRDIRYSYIKDNILNCMQEEK